MPRVKRSQPQPPPLVEDYPDPVDFAPVYEVEQPEPPRPGKKKNKNGQSRPRIFDSPSPEPPPEEEYADDAQIVSPHPSASPPSSRSLLHQTSYLAPTKSKPVNIKEDHTATEKVSDQYTPPSDAGLPHDLYGRSPTSAGISSAANTPPVEPGFSSRRISQLRSPPVSPPQRNARPVSYGHGIPPLPNYLPYLPSNYGSPPPPHQAQSHFYGAHDIDLGVPAARSRRSPGQTTCTKFIRLPSLSKQGIVTGYDGHLQVHSYDGITIESIGALYNLPGIVVDAELLQTKLGRNSLAADGPLLAVSLISFEADDAGNQQYRITVAVYSLRCQSHVADVLHTQPHPLQSLVLGHPTSPQPSNYLQLLSCPDHLIVSSGKSGEVFVFTVTTKDSGPTFECIRKLWTTIQPRERQRGSSHSRPGFPNQPHGGMVLVQQDENVPILAVSGRWLAVCPPSNTTLQSAGIGLGVKISFRKHAGLELLSPPTRPHINVDVDSPDVDTLLGKVARGVAQQMMKAGNWLGEQGAQAWQNYWKKDEDKPFPHSNLAPNPAVYNNSGGYGPFPPTHADVAIPSGDPDMVSVYDLEVMHEVTAKSNVASALATFQPPNGCSFLSFAPHGLLLMSASRKGDYQYIWDLLEMKSLRPAIAETESGSTKSTPRVRQVARFERLSGSTIVDVAWEIPTMTRLAVLTKNKTVHLFDIPMSALRWPPPRRSRKNRPLSAPADTTLASMHDAAPAGGFLANLASKTSPMLVSLRGRTTSTGGGFSGIGQAGIGIATATGARGSKAVATGLSKSLGAASETMSRMQHAGQSRLHFKSGADVTAGKLLWIRRANMQGISLLLTSELKHYQIRKSKTRDSRQMDTTVFDARKAIATKLPESAEGPPSANGGMERPGYWRLKSEVGNTSHELPPLSFAEIETNAPFQPFHSDRRVTMAIFEDTSNEAQELKRKTKISRTTRPEPWAFGGEISVIRLETQTAYEMDKFGAGSVICRDTRVKDVAGSGEQIVSTTRRRKAGRNATAQDEVNGADEEMQAGFFEDDCDVLDFASDRVQVNR